MRANDVRKALKDGALLFDGALGTYARALPGYPEGPVERACLDAPDQVAAIHRAYLDAGCRAIKTNTFAAHVGQAVRSARDQAALARAAVSIARDAAGERATVFADVGPAPFEDGAADAYAALADVFLGEGVDCFLFETLPSLRGIPETAARIRKACPQAFILVSFAANPRRELTSTVRRIYSFTVMRTGPRIVFAVRGDGFLYKQVRSMVGFLIRVGLGEEPPSAVAEMLAQCPPRTARVPTAPGRGLFLWKVYYGKIPA